MKPSRELASPRTLQRVKKPFASSKRSSHDAEQEDKRRKRIRANLRREVRRTTEQVKAEADQAELQRLKALKALQKTRQVEKGRTSAKAVFESLLSSSKRHKGEVE
jgi:hypothetical protein